VAFLASAIIFSFKIITILSSNFTELIITFQYKIVKRLYFEAFITLMSVLVMGEVKRLRAIK